MAYNIPKRHPELVSGSHREPSLILFRGQMLKRVQHDITRPQSQQTKNKPFNKILMKNKETWKLIIQTVISILSAIATTLGLNSCL